METDQREGGGGGENEERKRKKEKGEGEETREKMKQGEETKELTREERKQGNKWRKLLLGHTGYSHSYHDDCGHMTGAGSCEWLPAEMSQIEQLLQDSVLQCIMVPGVQRHVPLPVSLASSCYCCCSEYQEENSVLVHTACFTLIKGHVTSSSMYYFVYSVLILLWTPLKSKGWMNELLSPIRESCVGLKTQWVNEETSAWGERTSSRFISRRKVCLVLSQLLVSALSLGEHETDLLGFLFCCSVISAREELIKG